jgi:hypothetical protein
MYLVDRNIEGTELKAIIHLVRASLRESPRLDNWGGCGLGVNPRTTAGVSCPPSPVAGNPTLCRYDPCEVPV